MSKKLQLKIFTPEKQILEEMVELVTLPTTEGVITILPNHIPLIASLATGDIVATSNNEQIPIAVVGGFVEVKKLNQNRDNSNEEDSTIVTILADFAEHVSSISEDEIEKAKNRAEELRLLTKNKEIVDFEHFETELERSLNKIKIADKWRTRKYRK